MYFKTERLKIFSIIFELVLCDGRMKSLVMQILLVKQEKKEMSMRKYGL